MDLLPTTIETVSGVTAKLRWRFKDDASMSSDHDSYIRRFESYLGGVGHVDTPSIRDHIPESDFADTHPLLRARYFIKTVSGTSHLMDGTIDVSCYFSQLYPILTDLIDGDV